MFETAEAFPNASSEVAESVEAFAMIGRRNVVTKLLILGTMIILVVGVLIATEMLNKPTIKPNDAPILAILAVIGFILLGLLVAGTFEIRGVLADAKALEPPTIGYF